MKEISPRKIINYKKSQSGNSLGIRNGERERK